MADQTARTVPKFRPKNRTGRNIGGVLGRAIEVIIIILVIYYVAVWIIGALSVTNVSGATTFTLTNSTTLFTLGGNEYSIVLLSDSGSASIAQVSLTEQPTFLNPTLFVTLDLNNATKINEGTQYANMEIQLGSINNPSSITVTITPISTSLDIAPDSYRISVAQTTLSPFGVQSTTVPPLSTTSTTSTTSTVSTSSSSTTSSSTSSSSSTTTTTPVNNYEKAVNALHQDVFYPLMVNYTAMYANTSTCSPALYNNTYFNKWGNSPSGPDTYQNISSEVPSALTLSITNTTPTNYTATYSTVSQALGTTPSLIININTASGTIVSTQLRGSYLDLNYTILSCAYTAARSIGNACGLYVTSSVLHPSKC